jgi:hypothetical protein
MIHLETTIQGSVPARGSRQKDSSEGLKMSVWCGWTPQVQVLAFKAIATFVSHCGWYSILESLWYGVPIITSAIV